MLYVSGITTSRLQRLLARIEHDSDNLALRKKAVREACDTGHWEVAANLLDVGLRAYPDEPELLALAGTIHLNGQQYAEAAQALSLALAQGLDSADLHHNLALARLMQDRHDQALELLDNSVAPRVLSLKLLLRARCLYHLKRPLEAIADCRAQLAVFPEDAEAGGLLALLLHEHDPEADATDLIDAALLRNPRQREALLAHAQTLAESRAYHAARDSFDVLVRAHPSCGRGWLGLAFIDLIEAQTKSARTHLELAALHAPDDSRTWHLQAWAEILDEDMAAAAAALERSIALDPTFAEAHGGLAAVAALRGKQDAAHAGIKRALRLDSRSMSARYAEMLLLARSGWRGQAQAALEAMLALAVRPRDVLHRDLISLHIRSLRERQAEPASRTASGC